MNKEIRQRRRAKDLSQEKLAELAGVCRMTVVLIEQGKHSPTLDTMARILRVLGGEIWIDWED